MCSASPLIIPPRFKILDMLCATASPRANTGPFICINFSTNAFCSHLACSFEPDVAQDSDEERVLRKKALQVGCPFRWMLFSRPIFHILLLQIEIFVSGAPEKTPSKEVCARLSLALALYCVLMRLYYLANMMCRYTSSRQTPFSFDDVMQVLPGICGNAFFVNNS
jgi:hypothetical protein